MKKRGVFSTYVEVILDHVLPVEKFPGILHVCGGDPLGALNATHIAKYSPRMWR